MAGKLGDLDSEMARRVPEHALGVRVKYMHTAHGCRAGVLDILDILVRVRDEHISVLRAKFWNNCFGGAWGGTLD